VCVCMCVCVRMCARACLRACVCRHLREISNADRYCATPLFCRRADTAYRCVCVCVCERESVCERECVAIVRDDYTLTFNAANQFLYVWMRPINFCTYGHSLCVYVCGAVRVYVCECVFVCVCVCVFGLDTCECARPATQT